MSSDKRPDTTQQTFDHSNDSYQKVLNTALRILTARDHSKYELAQKLKQRGFTPENIQKAVSECERLDYVNDERTSQGYIRRLISKGYGINRIRHEMNQKRLRGQKIQKIISQTLSEADERDVAERILKKNIRRFEREPDLKKRRDKAYRFLYGRGFSQETIGQVIKNFF